MEKNRGSVRHHYHKNRYRIPENMRHWHTLNAVQTPRDRVLVPHVQTRAKENRSESEETRYSQQSVYARRRQRQRERFKLDRSERVTIIHTWWSSESHGFAFWSQNVIRGSSIVRCPTAGDQEWTPMYELDKSVEMFPYLTMICNISFPYLRFLSC